ECIGNVDTMQITYAARNSNYAGLNIEEGDLLALYEDKLLCADKDIKQLLKILADKAKHKEKKFISIYYGSDVSEDMANEALAIVKEELKDTDAEVTLYKGNQPVYYFIISAE
ncbi:MAG: DAK2 domain-containing protein, partial [Eubacteriales bacterium]